MFGYNFELAWRGLRHHPRTTLLVVLTMALGLASAMTTLTLLHVLSSDPLPGISQHLYMGWVDSRQLPKAGDSTTGSASGIPSHLKLADAQALLTAHRAPAQVMLTEIIQDVQNDSGGKTQSAVGIAASSGLFPMFGIALLHGRYWTPAEDAAHAPVVVISGGLSREVFGTQDSVGRTLRVGGKPFRVIGVSAKWAPQPHFYGLDLWAFSSSNADSLFLPVGALLDSGLGPFASGGCDDDTPLIFGKVNVPHCRWLSLWVQLNDAAQVAGYRQFLLDYASQQHGAGRFERPPHAKLYSVPGWLALNHVVPDNVRLNVWLAGGFLLLCMVNVAGLLAARFLRRSVEIGVRRALGAPRQAIFAQCVWEAGMAGVLGGALALPLTSFGLWVVRRQHQGYTDLAHLDPLTFAGLFGLALVVGLLVGMLPAWRACRVEPGLQVKSA
ncbi:MAG TPA: ABC transporter permease [Rhodanobacter sp.]|nr:ABC transporter permease [Rhodanobacter sp.]